MTSTGLARLLRESDTIALGQRIKDYREAAHRTQADLGESAGVTGAYVSRIESGDRKPSLDVLEQFADIIGVDPLALVTDVPAHGAAEALGAARRAASATSIWLAEPTNTRAYARMVAAVQAWEGSQSR